MLSVIIYCVSDVFETSISEENKLKSSPPYRRKQKLKSGLHSGGKQIKSWLTGCWLAAGFWLSGWLLLAGELLAGCRQAAGWLAGLLLAGYWLTGGGWEQARCGAGGLAARFRLLAACCRLAPRLGAG